MTPLRSLRVAGFLALRSFGRGNIGVTLLSVAMMIVVFISVSFLPALISGAVVAIDRSVVTTLTGDLTITSANESSIHDASEYLHEIDAAPGVDAATGIRRVGNQIAYGEESNAWAVDAIDPESFAEVFATPQNLIEGEYLQESDESGILLGIDIAGVDRPELRAYSSSLKSVHAGDTVSVSLVGGSVATFTVRGIYQNNFALSDQGAYITAAAADALESTVDYSASVREMYDAFDEIAVALDSAADDAAALAEVSAALASGSSQLSVNAEALASGAAGADSGADTLAVAARALDDAGQQLASGASGLAGSLSALAGQLSGAVSAAAESTALGAAAAATGAAALAGSCPPTADPGFCADLSANAAATAASAASAQTTVGLVHAAAASADAAAASASALSARAGELSGRLGQLAASAAELSAATGSVADGSAALAASAASVAAGADGVSQSASQMASALRAGADGVPETDEAERDALLDLLDNAGSAPGADSATRVVVTADDGVSPEALAANLEPIRDDVEYQTSEQLAAAIQDQVETFDLVNQIMRVISLLVAAITVFIITYVDLSNRRRQIGIERAIGIRSGAIVGSYVLKSLATAAVGTVLGAVLFRLGIVPLVDRFPFTFPNGPVTLQTDVATTLQTVAILLVVAAISATLPAVRTVRMKILDAIWGT
ncbi:hypothetical protein BH09ACT3_BH09ACT3_11180 [soil metagenome]